MAGLQPQLSATVAAAAGVEVRDGCQVSTTLGQHSIWHRAAAAAAACCSWLRGPSCQHLPQRLDHLPWAWGGGSSLSSQDVQKQGPPSPDLDLSSCAERQMQKLQPVVVSHVWLCVSCRVINACCWMPRNKVLACKFTGDLIWWCQNVDLLVEDKGWDAIIYTYHVVILKSERILYIKINRSHGGAVHRYLSNNFLQ